MKEITCILILMMILITVPGCKKSIDASFPVRISYFDIRPQVIGENDTAWITLAISDLQGEIVLIKTLAEYGLTNPMISSSTGNPVFIEYIPPELEEGETLQVKITVMIMDFDGKELDRAEGWVTVKD